MADICQTKDSSVAPGEERVEEEEKTGIQRWELLFSLEDIFFKTTRRKYFIFQSLYPQALQNINALLSSWKIRAMITSKKFYLSEYLPSM